MTALTARVMRGLRSERLAGAADRVVVALSGGPDSVALTLLLAEALPPLGATLVGVAHLHHGLRGADADADEAFCRGLAAALGIGCEVERVDVRAMARAGRVSLEVAGHEARYAFYERARRSVAATRVATGHTMNDLAETFLMRALRGAGTRGLAAIRPSRGTVIRPLLGIARAELLAFLEARGQGFCVDASNRDTRILRNRVRHQLMPWLERQVTPGAVAALARAARLAADDDAWLQECATRMAAQVVLTDGEAVTLDAAGLAAGPRAVRGRVLLQALEAVAAQPATAAAVERLAGLVDGALEGVIELPGAEGALRAGHLVLRRKTSRTEVRELSSSAGPSRLDVPGTVMLPGGARIEALLDGGSMTPGSRMAGEVADGGRAVLDADRVRQPLSVRFRWPGARLRPLGMRGHKKVQDILVDRKVPRNQRDLVPIVVDADGRIVWVAGHVIADEARVTEGTTSVLLLTYRC